MGPLDVHFLQPMHFSGSTQIRLKVGAASFATRTMQSSTGQRSWQTGEPAQPVQLSLIHARIFGFRLRFSLLSSAMGWILSPRSRCVQLGGRVRVSGDLEDPLD